MDLDAYFGSSSAPLDDLMDVPAGFKSGFVTFIGRPNSGKSTLLNKLVGEKVAIVSNVANTTRHRFSGVVNGENYQIVITDTPGYHKPKDALGEELNISAEEAAADNDVICVLIDATKPFGAGDKKVIDLATGANGAKFCLITKTDIARPEEILKQISEVSNYFDFDEVIPLSSVKGSNVDELISLIVERLPQGHLWFPRDESSDVDEEVFIAELIREKLLGELRDEIPHTIGVVIDELYYDENRHIYDIEATIIAERESHIGMIVGKSGATLKAVGSKARPEIEKLLGSKVNLQLHVKVKKNWRRDANMVKRFGYGN